MVEINYRNLTVERKEVIIDDFNLQIEAGALCVIVGPSGCGKSTLLETTAGLLAASQGEIEFNGEDITPLRPEQRKIGYVFQDYALYPNMTVFQNIEFGLKLQKVKKAERKQKVEDILEVVNLSAKANKYPSMLSGGECQRVAIARALVLEPEVLLMDEPLSSLDANLRARLRNQIKEIHNQFGKTIIFVTHDQSEALSLADHIVVMNDGKIEQAGTPFEVYNNPSSEFVLNFFNSEYINKLENKQIAELDCNSAVTFIRPNDIELTPGEEWTITDSRLHGEMQVITIVNNQEVKLFVSLPSNAQISIGAKSGIIINKLFSF